MTDYISREAAEVAFCNYMGATSGRVALMAEQIFNSIPAADVVEVVRCRDCRWWDKIENSPIGYCYACKHGHYSDKWEISIRRTYKGDFFCADGERNGGADNADD